MNKFNFLSDEPFYTNPFFIILVVIVVLVILIAVGYISASNKFNRMIVKIDESESSIDIALTKRHDLLKKMFQVVKGYAAHEQETLTKVIAMRQPGAGAPIGEKQEYSNQITEAMRSINVVVEQYPELKANTNFIGLQNAVSEVEENLQSTRRIYNSNISAYNQAVVAFPDSIVAGFKHLTKKDFFEAEASKREDVDLDFSK